MQEDIRKNFVLLSKAAKEKKYAQEYLGLLARRGDIGSIRIGKRWYTTTEWFSEFLADAEAKKAEMKTPKSLMATGQATEAKIELAEKEVVSEKIKIEKVFLPEKIELRRKKADGEKLEIRGKLVPPKFVAAPSVRERKLGTIDLRMVGAKKIPVFQKNLAEKINGADKRIEKYAWQAAKGQEKIIQEWKIRSEGSSPNFAGSNAWASLFQKFAFSMAVVLVLVLLFQVGLVYKNELKRMAGVGSGVVAGAEDTRLDLAVVKNSSLGYLGDQGDKVKENISLSRVLVRAAMERENTEIK